MNLSKWSKGPLFKLHQSHYCKAIVLACQFAHAWDIWGIVLLMSVLFHKRIVVQYGTTIYDIM